MSWQMRIRSMLPFGGVAAILVGCLAAGALAQDAVPPDPQAQDELPLPQIPQGEDFGTPPGLALPPVNPEPGEMPPSLLDPGARAPTPVEPRREEKASPKAGENTDDKASAAQPKRAEEPREQDRDAMLAELYSHLAKAPDAEQSEPIAKTIETLWLRSGSDTIGLLMRRALKAVEEQRLDLALKLLDAVVELGPDYAEGWSRRAYVHYLRNDYTSAVGDLRRTLALEPNHYKALEGLARILREGGQKKSALKVYQQLLRIYPYMPGAKDAADQLTVEVEGQGI